MAQGIERTWQETSRLVYGGYLALQAASGVTLWVLMAMVPELRSLFELLEETPAVTDSFLVADMTLGVVGSATAAVGTFRGDRWAATALAFTEAALLYPTLFLVIWVASEGTGSFALAVMVSVSTITAWIWLQVSRLIPVPAEG